MKLLSEQVGMCSRPGQFKDEDVLEFGSCAMRLPSSIAAMVSALGTCVPSMMKGIRFSRTTVLMYTVITEEAESPTSSQKWVKRSFVRSSSEIVRLAMVYAPFFKWKTHQLYTNLRENAIGRFMVVV